MAEDTENETMKLLRDLRDELREGFADTRDGFEDMNARIDGLTHLVTLLAANISGSEGRIETLEQALAGAGPGRAV